MSGFTGTGRFELTHTRAMFWHRSREGCCESLGDIAAKHLVPAGFSWEFGNSVGNWIVVGGPGIAEGDTGPMYEAVSGRKSWTG